MALGRRQSNFARWARRGKVAKIVRALEQSDMVVTQDGRAFDVAAPNRERAVEVLGGIPGEIALEAIVRALDDRDDGVRRAAVVALAGRDEARAARALAAACGYWLVLHPDKQTMQIALEALLRSEDAGIMSMVGAAMATRGGDRALAPADEYLMSQLLERFGTGAAADDLASGAVQLLGSQRPAVRSRAATMLIWLGPISYSPLLDGLEQPESAADCAVLLGRLGDARAVPHLARLLTSENPDLRRAAAIGLGDLRTLSAVNALMPATHDPDHTVRAAALEALERLGPAAVMTGVAKAFGPVRRLLDSIEALSGAQAPRTGQLQGTLRALGPGPRRRRRFSSFARPQRGNT